MTVNAREKEHPIMQDVMTVEGEMKIYMSWMMKIFSPLMRFAGLLIPYEGDFKAVVRFKSEGEGFVFDRELQITPQKTFRFCSKMLPKGEGIMQEYLNLGFIWVADYSYFQNKVIIAHRGYKYKCFGREFKVPLEWLLGKGSAYEIAIFGRAK